ncbi:hypothetical protein vBBak6_011 [Bacillus phage v_B-Bak6]|uniref:Uncharacterized protein n=2 Tax=Basiliskvirus TaxID=3044670 RepID=A0A385IKA2_9CAUD|nr:hypothetical protein PP653_gp019 [Bacillus phage Basilisk]YP_010656926.1 hypothetical protein PP654_gp017 [Bacillus phage v_B-Bak10]AXY82973.1 hypothetical protein vBBak1_011 [Bacillus phage v_B-Bak1]AXY83093.1 hypothetical protein vBBak6_011 [Bacillus phage v_B-Bak6]AGR46682.1 hypothetical protein BASILISK_19 [Bacillus phage Basilisk]AXY83290.1 hypothetical protein vBBBak10_017 [Bacillus phage v_B-Bak10]
MTKRVTIDYKNGETRRFEVEDTSDIENAVMGMCDTIMFPLTDGTMQVIYIPNTIGINFEPEEIEVFGDDEA